MPKTRSQKSRELDAAEKKFAAAKGAVYLDFAQMGIDETDGIRAVLRGQSGSDAEFLVIKKTLLQLAAKKVGWSAPSMAELPGQVAVALSYVDEVTAANRVAAFAAKVKKDKKLPEARPRVIGGMLGTEAIDASRTTFLASLPGKDVLRAQVLGTMVAPLSGFVGLAKTGLIGGLARVLDGRRAQMAA